VEKMEKNLTKRTLRILGWVLCTFILWSNFASAQLKPKDLPESHRRWLEEEVVYIITPMEKDVFLQLLNDKERDLFITAFWKHRDPTPGTDKNEFREEHYRRLNHVNRRYRYAGKPGWKTDRGKVYLLLGEPNDVRIFHSTDAYYPSELWAYQGIKLRGLPIAFNLLFFQKGRIGDYILYIPGMMGPASLLANFMGDPTNYMDAYYELAEMDPTLATASMSLIPGERVGIQPSLASSALVQNLNGAIIQSIEDRYAQKFIDYKDIVEVEYSTNYLESDAELQIIKTSTGIPVIHFSLEPKNLSMGSYQSSIYTTLELNGILKDLDGQPVYQFERTVPLNFTGDQYEKMRQRPFSFTDKFPIIPGDYRFSYILKNKVSQEFTSFEANISISLDPNMFTMTSLLLGFNSSQATSPESLNKPFAVGNIQLYSQAKKSFILKDTLHVFFQIWSMPEDLFQTGSIRYTIYEEAEEKHTVTHPISRYNNSLNFLESFPLKNLRPGYYEIKVSLLNESGDELLAQQELFEISPMTYIARPWVLVQSRDAADSPASLHILGKQLHNKKDFEGSYGLLEKAYKSSPGNFAFSTSFAQLNFQLKRYEDVIRILEPFGEKVKENYELILLLGQTHQALSQYDQAIQVFNKAVDSFGVNKSLLNGLGECYLQVGQKEEALVAFQKSLEIDPNQEEIKEKIRSIK
jgi:GWxTD domain-containing protein